MKLSTSLDAAETTAELLLRGGQDGGETSSRLGLAGKETIGGEESRSISSKNYLLFDESSCVFEYHAGFCVRYSDETADKNANLILHNFICFISVTFFILSRLFSLVIY